MKRSFGRKTVLAAAAMVLAVVTPGISMAEKPATEGLDTLQTLEMEQLDNLRGRNAQTNVQSIQELDATVSNSSFAVDTMTTGGITIEQHALENFKGIGVFNIFTGHNNAVDAAVGISVFLSE